LSVKNIEVIYDSVILVLRGVSFVVPQGKIVALLGANGAGKSTTLKSVSTLLASERGEVTKGSIEFRGKRTEGLAPGEMVGMGMVQVMEGRHCFGHLSVEDNLITGAYARPIKNAQVRQELEKIYDYFPRLKTRRTSLAGYTSGGEQQMVAIGRAMMAKPSMLLLDEPSMGLAPQIVAEIFEIVRELNQKEGVSILLAEQNTNVALKYADYGYILESGRVMMDGTAKELAENADVKEFYLGVSNEVGCSVDDTAHEDDLLDRVEVSERRPDGGQRADRRVAGCAAAVLRVEIGTQFAQHDRLRRTEWNVATQDQ
jgi:branched-chain amino acid transport system ATP-binding protein